MDQVIFRPRVCAAIIRDNHILMVFHDHGDRSFWTLPGGGIEGGETAEEAVIREVMEEVNLQAKVVRMLFEDTYEYGPVYCYLVEVEEGAEAKLGQDPELYTSEQILKDIAWFTLQEKKDDMQVSKVIQFI